MSHNEKEIIFQPSTIDTIDTAMFLWLSEKMNIHCTTNEGWKKTEIFWIAGERAAQIKKKQEERDLEGTLVFPRISLERTDMEKDPTFKGVVQADLPKQPDYKGGTFPGARVINQKKTSNFANAQSYRTESEKVGKGQLNFKTKKQKKPVYITYSLPLPVYVKMMYKITLRADYQQQLNEMLQPFLTYAGQIRRFNIHNEGHKYECFFEPSFALDNNIAQIQEEERIYKSTFNIKTLGYLMGGGKNDNFPKKTLRENVVEFKISRERVVFKDKLQHTDRLKQYRE